MSVTTFIGKSLIAFSLCLQAYLLFSHKNSIDEFNRDTQGALSACDCIPPNIQAILKYHLRLVVVGLLLSSAFVAVTKLWVFKLTSILGLLALFWVEHHKSFNLQKCPIGDVGLWESVAVIGALIYLLGAECKSCDKKVESTAPTTGKAKTH